MAERCPECNAELAPGDAYCTECGTPRRGRTEPTDVAGTPADSEYAGWPAAPAGTPRAAETVAPVKSTAETDDDDFVPLAIPPQHEARGDRRAVAAVVFGVLLLAALAAAAWFLVGANDTDDDDGGPDLDRQDVPAWVEGGSPEVATPARSNGGSATPNNGVVVGDNVISGSADATPTLPVISPRGSNASPGEGTASPTSPTATGVSSPSVAGSPSPTTAPPARLTEATAPVASPTFTIAGTSTAIPTVAASPTQTSTPVATVTPTVEPTSSAPPASTGMLSTSAAETLSTIVGDIEPPVASPTIAVSTPSVPATPTAPADATTSTPAPSGDGTGGPPPPTQDGLPET